MRELKSFSNREAWLAARGKTIGGSDAAAALGLSPWKTNVQLWEELTGRRKVTDIGGNAAVEYGTKAEAHLRELFALDFPEFEVHHDPWSFWTNDRFPWAHASVDGYLYDRDGSFGVLEIKTASIVNRLKLAQFTDRLPVQYYVQLLYYMGILNAEFGILCAQLTFPPTEALLRKETRHYLVEREDVREDIKFVMQGVEKFYKEYVETGEHPPLILPEI